MLYKRRYGDRRKEPDLSQEELADMVGKTQRLIFLYETGKSDASGEVIISLAKALQTTSDYLLHLSGDPSRPLKNEDDLDDLEYEAVKILRSMPAKEQPNRCRSLEGSSKAKSSKCNGIESHQISTKIVWKAIANPGVVSRDFLIQFEVNC